MIYGYLRVSSDEQDVNSQKQGVVSFAEKRGWTIEKFISDEGVSGGKDPSKRKLGPMLSSLEKGDIVICSEISRLGRDLYMVMDILHFCMERGVVIYTVKDNFTLGDDIQSKVLAFAFGLSAEIERQMIRQRTKEGLKLRMKLGVLIGRGFNITNTKYVIPDSEKENILKAMEWGAPCRAIARKLGVDRSTLWRVLKRWHITCDEASYQEWRRKEQKRAQRYKYSYKDKNYCIVDLPREEVTSMIAKDMTIPEIAQALPQFTYEQVYDTILCDIDWNHMYREHGQLRVRKKEYKRRPTA